MATQNSDISTQNLLSAVVRLPAKDFERFFKNAKQIKDREAHLIAKIRELDLLPEKEKIYRKLLKKFRAENIAPEEHALLTDLSEELEEIGVQRLECAVEIAKIRNSTLEEVYQDLKIKPKNYG